MQLEEFFDFQDSGAIRLKGHRIGIEHIIDLFRGGYTVEEMVHHFPGLSLEQAYAAVTYYLHNQAELDAYVARLDARGTEEYEAWSRAPSPAIERLRNLRAQRDVAKAS
jgi:uncharacterized protein (DUF433 family)